MLQFLRIRIPIALLLPVAITAGERVAGAQSARPSIIGRWDLTIQLPDGNRPSWLEVRRSGNRTLVGQFVGIVGNARPVSRVEFADGQLRFVIPPQWEDDEGRDDLTFEARLEGDRLVGSVNAPDGRRVPWTASRAPTLRDRTRRGWGRPVRLLGTDLTGWRPVGKGANEWRVVNGVLRNEKTGANLATERVFTDFRLHVEFRYPKGGNSGVYLRGRHEVQIADDSGFAADPPANLILGSIYGFLSPSVIAARKAGEWQTYDITLVGRKVTVVLNGRTIICDREIPGITGGALDSDEGAPGPLMLQGDHGPIEYRNIILTPAR